MLGAAIGCSADAVACNALDEQAVAREVELLSTQIGDDLLMSEEQVASLLKIEPKTLQNQRFARPEVVPPYVEFPGRRGVLYPRHEVLRFIAQRILLSRGRRIHKL